MKKYLFILGLVGTALLTACSTADDLVADIPSTDLTEEEKAMIVEAGLDSDVPITLGSAGSSRATTRSSLKSTEFQIPDGRLSVYCLATDIQAGAPNISAIPGSKEDIKWDGSVTFADWLVNQPAIVSYYNGIGDSPIAGGNSSAYSYIQFWKDGAVKGRYYPFGNWYSYDFFAYYPRVGNSDTSYSGTGKACFAKLAFDGKADVIWAQASGAGETAQESSTSPIVKAYSSKYIRLKKAESSEINIVPEFEFKHLLSQFVFTIKPHPGDEKELHEKGFAVSGFKFTEIPTRMQLVVASKEDSHINGDFEDLETPETGNIKVWTVGTDVDPFAGSSTILVAETEDDQTPKDVGYAMVPPSKTINGTALVDEHTVTLEMKQTSGDAVPNTVVTLPPPAGGFLPGKIYHVEIEIFNPTIIQAKATLVGWEDVVLPTVVPVD